MLTYNLSEIPFSLPGSFLTLTTRNQSGTHRLLYRTCSAKASQLAQLPYRAADFFEIALLRNGLEVPYTVTAQPHRVDLAVEGGGSAVFAFADEETLAFDTSGVNVRLLSCKPFPVLTTPNPGHVNLVDPAAQGVHMLRARHSLGVTVTPSATILPQEPEGASKAYTIDWLRPAGALRFHNGEQEWDKMLPDMADVLSLREKQFDRWLKRMPKVGKAYQSAAEIAWLLLWNTQVPATGALTRPVIYMSKFWMNNIWAWDNCFNALAIAAAFPEMAWEQLMLFFDHQTDEGQLPDSVNDVQAVYNYVKPPIHGWTIRKLVELTGMKESQRYLRKLAKPLEKLAGWWYTVRDDDHNGMCQYNHGNDSGWDNATAFDQGYPTEGSDLAAHLVLLCEEMAFINQTLGKNRVASRWQKRAEEQLATLLERNVKDGHFISTLNRRRDAPPTQSLLNYVPLELGHRLPQELRATLVADLQPGGPFLTENGLATESPESSKYEADGYWRGPIWAPPTYQIFDGLVDAGETQLARTIAERFCNMYAKAPGSWENFDALTGEGLRCPGYTWTASVFLLLAHWLVTNSETKGE